MVWLFPGGTQIPSPFNPPLTQIQPGSVFKQLTTHPYLPSCRIRRRPLAIRSRGFVLIHNERHDICGKAIRRAHRVRKRCCQVHAKKTKKLRDPEIVSFEPDPEGTKSTFLSKKLQDESELPPWSEVVPMDTEVLVYQEQKGFFPSLQHLAPTDKYLSVVVTREYSVVDAWVAQREAESKVTSVGYMIHLKHIKSRAIYAALIQNTVTVLEEDSMLDSEPNSALKFNGENGPDEDDSFDKKEVEEEDLSDFEKDLYGEVLDSTEQPWDDDDEDNDDDDDTAPKKKSDYYGEEQEEYPRLRNGGAQGLFDYYQDDYNEDLTAKDNQEIREALEQYPGQDLPPLYHNREDPPRVWTKSEEEIAFWENDNDEPNTEQRIPDLAIPLIPNRISLLTLAIGSKILIVQTRRMRSIPPRLYDLLYDTRIIKHAFDHENKAKLLKDVGLVVNGGCTTNELLMKAYNAPDLNSVSIGLQTLSPQRMARLTMGVDISDREFYYNDYNNPLLSERHVNCLAREAYSVWGIQEVLLRAERPNFFNIGAAILNPIPVSFVEQSKDAPTTKKLSFVWERGPYYRDLGKLLPGSQFDVEVTVTRDPEVIDKWSKERWLEKVESFGYSMEWCPGREGRTSAIFSLATEKKVLICQQLYMDHIPVSLLKLLNMRIYRKLGPTPSLYVHKLGDDRVFFKGCRSIFFYFLTIFKKLLKENLPKPVRDLNFEIACDLFVAIKNVPERPGHNMRWDKPEFSDEEIEYQGLRAWYGWALDLILTQANPEHAERLKAYLLGPSYIPTKPRIPSGIQKQLQAHLDRENEKFGKLQQKSPPTKGLMYQQTVDEENMQVPDVYIPEKLEKMAVDFGQVSVGDLNELLDSFF